jgi:putative toxin-antitoxin system antitoxin component (TIGR02293 family)
MNRPAIGLEHRKPVDLLVTYPGAELVEQYLTQIEYGVYI